MNKFLSYLCGASMLISSFSFASEKNQEQLAIIPIITQAEREGHQYLPAGTQQLSQTDHGTIQERRAQRVLEMKDSVPTACSEKEEGEDSLQEIVVGEVKDESDEERITNGAYYYYTSHPGALHSPIRVWEFHEKIELQDGSIWNVALSDRWKIVDWLLTDVVIILPNHSFFSIYDYILVNQRTGDFVEVNLSELEILPFDPTFFGWRRWIVGIDYIANMVYLNDGSVWTVSTEDDSTFLRWSVGEIVIIGINDDWDSSIRSNILIHFNTAKWVHANCLN